MGIFEELDELNHKKIILMLEKEKDDVESILNSIYGKGMLVSGLGDVSEMNPLQYLLGKMINRVELRKIPGNIENRSLPKRRMTRLRMILIGL
jgi:hypothetical protein